MEVAQAMVGAFLNTPFEGGRHAKRVEKIDL
jgi:ribose 5-phosphate isomerase RpiB